MKARWQFWTGLVLTLGFAFALKAQQPAKPHYVAEVNIFGEITEESAIHVAGQLVSACTEDGTDPILMVINSGGGDILAGAMIIDAMQECSHPVDTLDIGEAQSMAAMIFEYGHHREMWPRALLMMHDARLTIGGSPQQARNTLNMVDRYISELEHYVAARAELTYQQYRARASDIWYLRADEAIAAHLADEVTPLH